MRQFPSSLEFASLLQYSPRGTSDVSKQSRVVTYALKQDGVYSKRNVIDYSAEVVEQELASHAFLADYFADDVSLVPVPRSSPQRAEALWPPLRICQALLKRGLVKEVLPCLKRKSPVRKASLPGLKRPEPADHFNSILLTSQPSPMPARITLVDDVITRGSSFMGIFPHLAAAFPGVPIHCFAIVRTVSMGEISTIREPVCGTVTYQSGQCVRLP